MSENLFYQRHSKTGEKPDDKFDVDVDPKMKTILFVVLGILILLTILYPNIDNFIDTAGSGLQMDWWAPIVFVGLTVPVIFLWGKIGPSIGQTLIIKWLKKVSAKKKTSPAEFFVGFPMAVKDPYYIEASPMDFDIKKPGFFINRVKEPMFLSIGISIILSQFIVGARPQFILDQFAYYGYTSDAEIIIYSAIYLGPLALLALFFILPMFWIGEDIQVYRVDQMQDPYRVGMYLRGGMLSKILGFFGVVLAFNTCKDFAVNPLGAGAAAIGVYTLTFVYLIFVILGCSLPPYLVSLCYLIFFHKEWVNTTRIKASEFLPVATMQIKNADKAQLNYLTHPEKLSEFDKADVTDKPAGKIIVIGLCIASAVIAFLLSFVWVWGN